MTSTPGATNRAATTPDATTPTSTTQPSTTPGATTSYDRVPYPSHAYSQTHPDRLATVATLLGMRPAPPKQCRLLELGCGAGTNLIAMAFHAPRSEFLGFDLAPSAIEEARVAVAELGLRNLRFEVADLRELPDDLGHFDYVVSHGVYSGVPAEARDALLAACARHLAPQGVGYVSYNAYPGWHIRDMVRGMVRFHVRTIDDPQEKIRQGRGLLQLLAQSCAGTPDVYRQMLAREVEYLARRTPFVFFHDTLSEVNHPVWFHEFVAHAARHGLQFLGEADWVEPNLQEFPQAVADGLAGAGGDRLLLEQYVDFVKCRAFRQTLLCRFPTELRSPEPSVVRALHVAAPVRPASATPDLASRSVEAFEAPKEGRVETDLPVLKAALVVLGRSWPRTLGFDALYAEAAELAGAREEERADLETALAALLYRTYCAGVSELHVEPRRTGSASSPRPRASALTIWQASTDRGVTTLCEGVGVVPDPRARTVLSLLDGTRDKAVLLRAANERVASLPAGTEGAEPLSSEDLESLLEKLVGLGLLLPDDA